MPRLPILAASAAIALAWTVAASAQSNLDDFRKDADRALISASGGASHCDRTTVRRAREEIDRLQQELVSIGKKARRAGTYGAVDERELKSVQAYVQSVGTSIDAMKITGCDEMSRAFGTSPSAKPKEEPKGTTGEVRPLSPYRPAQATPEMKASYRHDIEAEFGDVERARAKGDCAAWDAAIARLTALLNDYRAMARGEADPATRVIWADRLARAKEQRPKCADPDSKTSVGTTGGDGKAKPPAKTAETTPAPKEKPAESSPKAYREPAAPTAPIDQGPPSPRDKEGPSQAQLPASETGYGGAPDRPVSCEGRCTVKPRAPGRICATDAKGEVNKCNLSEPPPK